MRLLPGAMRPVTSRAPVKPPAPKKMVPSRIRLGNRPLQGRKALVRMAISRSRGVDDPAAGDPGGVAAQTHTHSQCLFAAGAAAG